MNDKNTLHPDILADLVILYQTGEASSATRAFLECEAAVDAEVARQLALGPPMDARIEVQQPRDAQRRALKSLGHWNRLYSTFTGLGYALTLVPFSFLFRTGSGELTFFLWRDFPTLCVTSICIGIACFVAASRFRRLRNLS